MMSADATPSLLAALTLEEKVSLLSGRDVWRTAAIERLGIGSVKVTDGPNGARGDSTTGARALCLPAAIGLGATFDRDLVIEAGALLGRETRRKGSHVLLAPTINLARHPLGGRNFESFGEDPYLTAQLAVAYVAGVQSEGVGACAKHFVANDVEYARMTVSSEVDETVLREIYLAPFDAVVDAGVWSVMASYPMLNGTHCTEHEWLLTTVLRVEWGFDGLVMSDWGATHHRSRPVLAGLDLEMPGPPFALGRHLLDAVADGEVPESVVDERASRVLQLAARAGRINRVDDEPERSIELPEDRQLARRAAADGMVLLTNDGSLPLPTDLASVTVIGPNAIDPVIQGGGSAQVPAHRIVTPLDGIAEAFGQSTVSLHRGCSSHRYLPPIPPGTWTAIDHPQLAGDPERPIRLDQFDSVELAGDPVRSVATRSIGAFAQGARPPGEVAQRWTGHLTIDVTGRHSFGVLAVGRSRVIVNGELVVDNWTAPRPGDGFFQHASAEVVGEVKLEAGTTAEVVVEWAPSDGARLRGLRFGHRPPMDDDALFDEAVLAAAAADAAVVVVGLTNEWETEGHDRSSLELPGRQDELVRRVAAANPRTVVVINAGGPVDLDWIDEPAAVVMAWYPGQELGAALADVLVGRSEPGGRLPVSWPRRLADTPFELPIPEPGPPRSGATLPYDEGLLIGYRSYDRNGVEPRFPFGFGLGYTTFELGSPTVADPAARRSVAVTVPVTNIGQRAGKCVVQGYLAGPDEPAAGVSDGPARPVRALAAFAVVRPDPGETVEARLEVPVRAFHRWDPTAGVWVDDGRPRRLHVGLSSRDLVNDLVIDRPGPPGVEEP